jgi:hypothetical protein
MVYVMQGCPKKGGNNMTPENEIQTKALALIRERINDPKFERMGGVNTSALASDVAEDLGIEESLADPDFWLHRMVNTEARNRESPPVPEAS